MFGYAEQMPNKLNCLSRTAIPVAPYISDMLKFLYELRQNSRN